MKHKRRRYIRAKYTYITIQSDDGAINYAVSESWFASKINYYGDRKRNEYYLSINEARRHFYNKYIPDNLPIVFNYDPGQHHQLGWFNEKIKISIRKRVRYFFNNLLLNFKYYER